MLTFQSYESRLPASSLEKIFVNQINNISSSEIIPRDTEFCLYGLGNLGRLAIDYLSSINKAPVAVIDENLNSQEFFNQWLSYTPIKISDISSGYLPSQSVAVSITTHPFKIFYEKLTQLGFTNIFPFYDFTENFQNQHPLSNGWRKDKLTEFEKTRIHKAFLNWDDEVSKAHFTQFIGWRLHRTEISFHAYKIIPKERYFIDQIKSVLKSNETIVDVGAHHGEFLHQFLSFANFNFKKFVLFEPDHKNRKILLRNLVNRNLQTNNSIIVREDIITHQAGVCKFAFGFGYASKIHDKIGNVVQSFSIDALGLEPSFLKLHIEGEELNALKGAQKTIERHRPIVLVTCYHNEDGLWKLPDFFVENFDDYNLHFRLHGWCGTSAVIYAIPHERLEASR